MSSFNAGAGEGNASTRSYLCSPSSPQTQLALTATGSLSSIFASPSTPSSLSAAVSLNYLSFDASSVLGTSKEHVHDDDAGSIHCTLSPHISQPMSDTKRKPSGVYHGERFTSSETEKKQSFASASAHGTDFPHPQLGDTGTLADMRPAETNLSEIDRLQVHDCAFVLRSRDKSWTYATIADRSTDRILFAVDNKGTIKTLLRRHWLTFIRLGNIDKDRSTTLPALHTSSPHQVSYLKCGDFRDQVVPSLPLGTPFTDTDYQRRRRVRFDPTIGNPIKVTHSNSGGSVHDIPFTDQMMHKDQPVKTSVLNDCIPVEGILRRHGTKFGRCLTTA